MSETFIIKKTLFDNNSSDPVLSDANSFLIGPGEKNGPSSTIADSDLVLYGFGSLKWGNGVDQNLYRLLENNACPEKTGITPPEPMDVDDLGVGSGITYPIIGEFWFNTTDQLLYVYRDTGGSPTFGWIEVTSQLTIDLNAHINNDDLHITPDQNVYLDGLSLTGSPILTSDDTNQLIGIDNSQTVQTQLNNKLFNDQDDTIDGNLTINKTSGNSTLFFGSPGISIQRIGTELIVTNTVGNTFTLKNNGNVSINATTTTLADEDLTREKYVRDNFVAKSGSVMNSNADITFGGGGEVLGLPNAPSTGSAATSSNYLNSTFAKINSPIFTGNARAVTPSTGDNDTSIATTAFVNNTIQNTPGNVRIFTTSGSFVAPITGTYFVTILGGGGGGAGFNGLTGSNGGVGNNGEIRLSIQTLVQGNTYSFTIGSGGAGSSISRGNTGSNTTFNGTTARGGTGGSLPTTNQVIQWPFPHYGSGGHSYGTQGRNNTGSNNIQGQPKTPPSGFGVGGGGGSSGNGAAETGDNGLSGLIKIEW